MLAVPITFIPENLGFVQEQNETQSPFLQGHLEGLEEFANHVFFTVISARGV